MESYRHTKTSRLRLFVRSLSFEAALPDVYLTIKNNNECQRSSILDHRWGIGRQGGGSGSRASNHHSALIPHHVFPLFCALIACYWWISFSLPVCRANSCHDALPSNDCLTRFLFQSTSPWASCSHEAWAAMRQWDQHYDPKTTPLMSMHVIDSFYFSIKFLSLHHSFVPASMITTM